jgi:hypothetical protein
LTLLQGQPLGFVLGSLTARDGYDTDYHAACDGPGRLRTNCHRAEAGRAR